MQHVQARIHTCAHCALFNSFCTVMFFASGVQVKSRDIITRWSINGQDKHNNIYINTSSNGSVSSIVVVGIFFPLNYRAANLLQTLCRTLCSKC